MLVKQLRSYQPYVNGTMSAEELESYNCFGDNDNNTMWGPPTYAHTFAGPCCMRKK